MFDIGRDDDKVPGLDGADIPVKKKVAFPVQNKEYLCKTVGVQHAVPVPVVLGQGDGEKAGVHFRNVFGFNRIMSVTHSVSSNGG